MIGAESSALAKAPRRATATACAKGWWPLPRSFLPIMLPLTAPPLARAALTPTDSHPKPSRTASDLGSCQAIAFPSFPSPRTLCGALLTRSWSGRSPAWLVHHGRPARPERFCARQLLWAAPPFCPPDSHHTCRYSRQRRLRWLALNSPLRLLTPASSLPADSLAHPTRRRERTRAKGRGRRMAPRSPRWSPCAWHVSPPVGAACAWMRACASGGVCAPPPRTSAGESQRESQLRRPPCLPSRAAACGAGGARCCLR